LRLLQGWEQAIPDGTGMTRRMVESGDTVVTELVWTGTQSGDLQTPGGTLPASGRQIEIEATMWSVFEGDKVRETRHYVDIMTMLQQLGADTTPS
jgi:predicted ester cyclase